MVILKAEGSPSIVFTFTPIASTRAASSVASSEALWARSNTWRLNPCGVWAATSDERSGVALTKPSLSISLMVSITFKTGITAL